MKAIETIYKNYKFRSRLEARYAVFFDLLGIEWSYEEEGYELNDGTWYLPDFNLPTFNGGMFVEVKPKFTIREKEKCADLCRESDRAVLLAEGTPDFKVYVYLVRQSDNSVVYFVGLPNADQAQDENRMFGEPGYEDILTGAIAPDYYSCLGDRYVDAVITAKQYRFEHKNK